MGDKAEETKNPKKSAGKTGEGSKSKRNANNDVLRVWGESHKAVLKMWEDSYSNLYKPWIESTGELFEKTVELSKDAQPTKYKEFYDELMKTYEDTFGKVFPVPKENSSKESLQTLLSSADELLKVYKSWVAELEENASVTKAVLEEKPDSKKYKSQYDMWMRTYEKIFDDLLTLPMMGSTKEVLEHYTGTPDVYSRAFMQILKVWRHSYAKLYRPWIESMTKFAAKIAELSSGDADPEAYKQFYEMWMDGLKEGYGTTRQSMETSRDVFESFVESTQVYVSLYKSWIDALNRMSDKAQELLKYTGDADSYRDFYDLWIKTYEKAFDTFFEDMPLAGPMKQLMEPVTSMTKIHADAFAQMSKTWLKLGFNFTDRV